jgi:outer membrane protein OmpA-like peptidoglycan-associated protein
MKTALTALALALATVACAPTRPPQELLAARQSYQQASQTPGVELAAGELYDARNALQAAEKKFVDSPGALETRDLAYIAQRKAIAAQARAAALASIDQAETAQREARTMREQQAQANRIALEQAKGALSTAQQQAESERRARVEAEKRAQDALMRIQGIESRISERGLVLTLSGSILFQTGKSTLLPMARARLAAVARALKEDKRSIAVVGHTDSRGSDEANMKLSQSRAEAVRSYLTTQGIDPGRVAAQGAGETQPIADNATPEGQANNRRVEIILESPRDGAPIR